MGKKSYRLKAAHARTFRWKSDLAPTQQGPSVPCDEIATDNTSEHSIPPVEQISVLNAPATTINKLAHGFDCGYTGGVNHDPSSDHLDVCTEILDLADSDAMSLCELDGNELEENLAALRLSEDMLEQSTCSNGWKGIFGKKSTEEWKKAESNRALGYNGHSKRAKRQKEKETRDRAAAKEKIKSS